MEFIINYKVEVCICSQYKPQHQFTLLLILQNFSLNINTCPRQPKPVQFSPDFYGTQDLSLFCMHVCVCLCLWISKQTSTCTNAKANRLQYIYRKNKMKSCLLDKLFGPFRSICHRVHSVSKHSHISQRTNQPNAIADRKTNMTSIKALTKSS